MSRLMTSMIVASTFALGIAVHAQDTRTTTTTKTSGDSGKTVTYTGCVQDGTATRSYVLNNVVPVSSTTAVGTSGRTETVTTYALVPGEKIEFQTHLNHKVEVTGVLVPAGDSKTETKTKVDRDDAPDTTTREKTKTENAMPQFRVTSIKNLAESCQ